MQSTFSLLLRSASVAVLLDLWWSASTQIVGGDVAGYHQKLLLAAVVFFLVGFQERRAVLQVWVTPAALVMGFVVLLVAQGRVYEIIGLLPGGASPVGRGFVGAVLLALPAIATVGTVSEGRDKIGVLVLGASLGLLLHEVLVLPHLGWTFGAGIWVAVQALGRVLAKVPDERPKPSRILFLFGCVWGVLFGVGFGCGQYFLQSRLSATRFSELAVMVPVGLGLALGCFLGASFGLSRARTWLRVLILPLSATGGLACFFWFLSRVANLTASEGQEGAGVAWAEVYFVLSALSVGSMLFGLGLRAQSIGPPGFALLVLAVAFGLRISPDVVPLSLRTKFLRVWERAIVLEQRATPDGVLTFLRSFKSAPTPRVRWNRDPISRTSRWHEVERQEILFPGLLSRTKTRALIQGTLFSEHKDAIPFSGFEIIDYLDPVPAFVDGSEEGVEIDPFRFLCQGKEDEYQAIIRLSCPFLPRGSGHLCSREVLTRYRELLADDGAFFLWVDLRAVQIEAVLSLLKTHFEVFPEGRLWMSMDGFWGPLLCLEGRVQAFPTPDFDPDLPVFLVGESADFRARLGDTDENTLDRPIIECGLPLEGPPLEGADPETLRGLADFLSPDPAARSAIWYLLSGLALRHEGDVAPLDQFATGLDWVQVSAESVEMLTVGQKLFPDFGPLTRALILVGDVLFDKNEFEILLNQVPQWLEARPDDVKLLMLMAAIHHALLDDELALPFVLQASALDPDSPDVFYLTGQIYSGLGLWIEAVEAFTVVYAIDPDHGANRRDLGIALFESGNTEEARSYLTEAVLDFPKDEAVKKALDALGGIQK